MVLVYTQYTRPTQKGSLSWVQKPVQVKNKLEIVTCGRVKVNAELQIEKSGWFLNTAKCGWHNHSRLRNTRRRRWQRTSTCYLHCLLTAALAAYWRMLSSSSYSRLLFLGSYDLKQNKNKK